MIIAWLRRLAIGWAEPGSGRKLAFVMSTAGHYWVFPYYGAIPERCC
jgi:hypothetical protein